MCELLGVSASALVDIKMSFGRLAAHGAPLCAEPFWRSTQARSHSKALPFSANSAIAAHSKFRRECAPTRSFRQCDFIPKICPLWAHTPAFSKTKLGNTVERRIWAAEGGERHVGSGI